MAKEMRSEGFDDEEISTMRKQFRDLFYESLKNGNKPLSASPDASFASSATAVEEGEGEVSVKGLYMLDGNPPIEARREDRLIIAVGREKVPRGPI